MELIVGGAYQGKTEYADVYSRTFPGRTENAAPLRSSVSVRES